MPDIDKAWVTPRDDTWDHAACDMIDELKGVGEHERAQRLWFWVERNVATFETVLRLGGYEKAYIFVLSQIDA